MVLEHGLQGKRLVMLSWIGRNSSLRCWLAMKTDSLLEVG